MEKSSKRAAIIVAGGTGTRFGGAIPKQFQLLHGKPLLCHTISAFHANDPEMPLVVVLPEAHMDIWRTLCIGHGFLVPHTPVKGGEQRSHSVRNGLAALEGDPMVAVHDGARPLITPSLIHRCFSEAERLGNAVPVVPITSSVRQVDDGRSTALDRSALRLVQTPQCFPAEVLRAAFALPYDPAFTDEATMVERNLVQVHLVDGDEHNFKVTTPLDMAMAGMILESRE